MNSSIIFFQHFETLLFEIFLTLSGLSLLIFNGKIDKENNYFSTQLTHQLCLGICLVLFFLLNNFLKDICIQKFSQDDLRFSLKFCFLLGVLGYFFLTEEYTSQRAEFSFLVLFGCTGLILLLLTADFLSVYLALEIQSFCFYILATLQRNSSFATEAGLKYFILGALASGFFLFGCSLLYVGFGTLSFTELNLLAAHSQSAVLTFASFFILVAFLFKLGVAPFHMWIPDVYEGAPTNVSIFFAHFPKLILLFLLNLLLYGLFITSPETVDWWTNLCGLFAILSISIGSLGAFGQIRIKRLLAYSGIGHMGYLIFGCSLGSIEGIQATFFYLFLYLLNSFLLWGILCLSSSEKFGKLLNFFKRENSLIYLIQFKKFVSFQPLLCFILCIGVLSLGGLPPFSGFLAKFMVFFASIQSSHYLPSFFIVFFSAISVYYSLKIIKTMVFEEENFSSKIYVFIKKPAGIIIVLTFASIFYFFITPMFLYLLSYQSSLSFFHFGYLKPFVPKVI